MRPGLATSIVLVVFSAVLGIAVFPPFSWPLLAPLAWCPLFIALQGRSAAAGFRLGVLHGLILYAGTLNWLFGVFGPMAFMLLAMLAFFTGLFASAAACLSRISRNPLVIALLTATLWAGWEYFRSECYLLRLPWITPGTGLPPNWLTPLLGVYGVSFLIALANSLIAAKGLAPRLCGFFATGGLILSGVLRPGMVKPQHPIHIAAIQTENGDLDSCLRLSATIPGQVDAIVWPEYAVSYDIRTRPEELAKVRALMKEKGAQVLVLANPVGVTGVAIENIALTLGLDGIFGSHVKNHPVHFMADGRPGKTTPVIATPLGKISTPICFDNDYQDCVREGVRDGAEFLLIPSMEAEDWSAREHLQHALFAQHRAAENARWLVVSSTSGRTQIVDPHGNVTPEVIPLMKEGVLIGDIDRKSRRTFYNRAGWLIGPLCMVLAGAITATLLISWIRQRKKEAFTAEEPKA